MQNTNQKYLGIDDSTIIVNGAKTVNESLIQKVEATIDNEGLRIPQDLIVVQESSNKSKAINNDIPIQEELIQSEHNQSICTSSQSSLTIEDAT
jgi:hypothetical protein